MNDPLDDLRAFRRRAAEEAARYGADRAVFVRELVQNARDAGATRVEIEVTRESGLECVRVIDDGEGMSLDHARAYLFTLYASSKEGLGTAGRFGIGFWSVLRFEPSSITLRSRPLNGEGWEIVLDGALEHAEVGPAALERGVEVVLERPRTPDDLEEELLSAARRYARFVRCRDEPERPLLVAVNQRLANEPFTLPAPSLAFSRRGLRGVVALGAEPRVELFAHGLQVREAALLDELLSGEGGEAPDGELAEGLLPSVLLDSGRLRPLLARRDARDDPALRRAVAEAGRELGRLIELELERSAPRTRLQRAVERLAHPRRGGRGRLLGAGILAAAAIGGALGLGLSWWRRGPVPVAPKGLLRAYGELASAYRGPSIDPLDHDRWRVDLAYRPAAERPLFGILRLAGIGADGAPVPAREEARPVVVAGDDARAPSLEITLTVAAGAGALALPTAAGQAVVPGSVELEGEGGELRSADAERGMLRLSRAFRGRVRYRTAPASSPALSGSGPWPPLPAELAATAAGWRALPLDQRIERAETLVRSRLVYDRTPATARVLAAGEGSDLVGRLLAAGGGDCDLLNTLLASLLAGAGSTVQLVIGLEGRDGVALPGLHAWVEVVDSSGRWQVADATVGARRTPGVRPVQAARPTASSATSRWEAIASLAALLVAVLAGAWLELAGRVRRRPRLDEPIGVGALVRGALENPRAFAAVPTLFAAPLVPRLRAGPISLRRAQALAAVGRLFASARQSELAERAAAAGAVVLDADSDAGRVVAVLCGATDLDRWESLLADADGGAVCARVEAALEAVGERWRVRLVDGLGAEIASLDLGRGDQGVVAIERGGAVGRAVGKADLAAAALLVADLAVEHLDLRPTVQARVRCRLAREAIGAKGGER